MWPINLSHSPIYSNILHFSQANSGCILHFSKTKHPRFLHFSRKSLLRYFGYGVRHSMIKSASIVRNLSKNHTFRTIASILINTQSRFPANLTILIIQLHEARINPIGYNDSVIYPQLYPNGIILA